MEPKPKQTKEEKAAYLKKWRAENRDKFNEYRRDYYQKNRTEILESQKPGKAKYREANREKLRADSAAFRTENLEEQREYHKEYMKEYRAKMKTEQPEKYKEINKKANDTARGSTQDWYYGRKYGITKMDYDKLAESQLNKCDICGTHQDNLDRLLDVDHCHKSGKIRGLLCRHCNLLIGHAKDSVETLKNAVEYLNKNTVPTK